MFYVMYYKNEVLEKTRWYTTEKKARESAINYGVKKGQKAILMKQISIFDADSIFKEMEK